jgi:hypothetical protein
LAPEKRRSGSADIAGTDSISRAILLKFGYTFCWVSSNHQRRGSSISHTISDWTNRSYSSIGAWLLSSFSVLIPPFVRVFVISVEPIELGSN